MFGPFCVFIERTCILFLTLALLLSYAGGMAVGAENGEEYAAVFLNCRPGEEKNLFLEVILTGVGLCGALILIKYDADAVNLSRCERGEASTPLNFSFEAADGAVAILLDGVENCSEGVIARLEFEVIGEGDRAEFDVVSASDEAYRRCDDGDFVSVTLSFHGTSVEIDGDAEEPRAHVRYSFDGEGTVAIEAAQCFSANIDFAGYKVFVAGLDGQENENYYVFCRVTGEKGGEMRHLIRLPTTGRRCVIVTPVLYDGRELTVGEKIAVYVCCGEVYTTAMDLLN